MQMPLVEALVVFGHLAVTARGTAGITSIKLRGGKAMADRVKAQVIHGAINAALEAIAAAHGLKYETGSLKFGTLGVRMSFRMDDPAEAAKESNRRAGVFGLHVRVGEDVALRGTKFTVAGVTESGCVLITRVSDKKEFRMPARSAKNLKPEGATEVLRKVAGESEPEWMKATEAASILRQLFPKLTSQAAAKLGREFTSPVFANKVKNAADVLARANKRFAEGTADLRKRGLTNVSTIAAIAEINESVAEEAAEARAS